MIIFTDQDQVLGNMRTWTLIDVNDNHEIDNMSCTYSSSPEPDSCYENKPVLYARLKGFKDFGDEVVRDMERKTPTAPSAPNASQDQPAK